MEKELFRLKLMKGKCTGNHTDTIHTSTATIRIMADILITAIPRTIIIILMEEDTAGMAAIPEDMAGKAAILEDMEDMAAIQALTIETIECEKAGFAPAFFIGFTFLKDYKRNY